MVCLVESCKPLQKEVLQPLGSGLLQHCLAFLEKTFLNTHLELSRKCYVICHYQKRFGFIRVIIADSFIRFYYSFILLDQVYVLIFSFIGFDNETAVRLSVFKIKQD